MGFVLGKRFSGGKLICREFLKTPATTPMFLPNSPFALVCPPVENYGACSSFLEALLSASANQPRRRSSWGILDK